MNRGNIEIPVNGVSAYEALYNRRSVWKYKDQIVNREVLERMFQTTVWAPNHRLTEPWRFFVLDKDSDVRNAVAEVAYDYMMDESGGDETRSAGYRAKVLDPPIVVFVYQTPGKDEFEIKEDYGSMCMAVQNLSLAGYVEGVSVTIETGRVIRPPKLNEALGADPDWLMVMMLTIGYPDEDAGASRTPASSFIVWE